MNDLVDPAVRQRLQERAVLVVEKLGRNPPELVVRPNVGTFRLLDFFKASAILRAADAIKPEVKTRLAALLKSEP